MGSEVGVWIGIGFGGHCRVVIDYEDRCRIGSWGRRMVGEKYVMCQSIYVGQAPDVEVDLVVVAVVLAVPVAFLIEFARPEYCEWAKTREWVHGAEAT